MDDLPVTYELNAEGTEWVGRMMSYTVAGGKMNRGLATLSVRNTFAKLVGHTLNNKVLKMHSFIASLHFCGSYEAYTLWNLFCINIRESVRTWLQERCQAAALGWCIEFLQAFFLVADDLMDDSVTRRGQPCWFRLPEVKTIAVNDRYANVTHPF